MSNWPAGYELIELAEVDSTNAEAARRARNLSDPVWIRADRQSAARGRRGRPWIHPAGNLATTLVLQPTEPPETVALRSFMAALALYDATVAVTGRPEPITLKWPNDVLINGGKFAGILLESIGTGTWVNHLAIGFGVNLSEAPDLQSVEANAVRPVSLVGETGMRVSPSTFLEFLAVAYAEWELRFVTFGFGPIREAWLARAARLGEVITARTGTVEMTGTFETVDNSGALVLKTPKGRRAIPAADVYF